MNKEDLDARPSPGFTPEHKLMPSNKDAVDAQRSKGYGFYGKD